jgi:hypothetical protein
VQERTKENASLKLDTDYLKARNTVKILLVFRAFKVIRFKAPDLYALHGKVA